MATFLLTNFGSRSNHNTRVNIGKLHYTERVALTREGLSSLVLSALTQVLTLQLRKSVDVTVVAATLS